MAYMDNPAGRLQRLFEAAKEQPQGNSAVAAWCEVFELTSPEDDMLLVEQFGRMVTLANETRDQVERLRDDDPDLMLQHFPEVESTLKRSLQVAGQTMEWHLSGLTTSGVHSLALCSSLLHRRTPEESVSTGDRVVLLDRVERLMDEVYDADDLDEAARNAILDKLSEILCALRDIDTRGALPLRQAADAMVGSLVTQRGVWQRAAHSKVASGLYGFIVLVDLVLNLSANASALEGPEPPTPSP
jgi:hypothetical protein